MSQMWEEKKTAGLLRVADPGGTFAGLQTEEPQWRCAFFSPWFLWKQRQKQRKLNEPEDQHAIRKVNEKVCTPSRRWHEHGVASPLLPLCIYFQVSAILSARAERSGRRNTASRKNKSDKQKGKKKTRGMEGAKTQEHEKAKVYSPLTLAIAFLYLMTACWMSECTLIFPSPHGTTTRVRPKHTVTFMAVLSESPGFGLRRRGRGAKE